MRSSSVRRPFALLALLGLAALIAVLPAIAGKAKHIAQYRTIAMTSAGSGVQGAGELDIAIDQWSSEDERATLIAAFKKGGNLELYAALQKQSPHGFFRQPGGLGYDIRFTRQVKTDAGSKVIVVTDKFVSDANFDTNSEFLKYPITVAELVLDEKGSGTGTMIVGARLSFDEGGELKIEVPSGQPPIPLSKVWSIK